MFQAFVLYLREGLEASLIISILAAALRQLGQTKKMRAVWTGVALALGGSALGAVLVFTLARDLRGLVASAVEGITLLVAVAILTATTFWMQRHSRTLKSEITAQASAAGSGVALGLIGFTSVGRESLETALFTLALVLSNNLAVVLLGAVLGVAAAIGLAFLIYRVGYRLDYRVFFRVMGTLLIIFAAGLLSSGIHELHEIGWIQVLSATIWNFEGNPVMGVSAPLGSLLHAVLGYTDELTWLQAIAYILYLAIAGTAFYRLTRKPVTLKPAPASAPAAPQEA